MVRVGLRAFQVEYCGVAELLLLLLLLLVGLLCWWAKCI